MSIQNKIRKILLLSLLLPMLVQVGCALPKQTQTQTKQKPGLYGLQGWNSGPNAEPVNTSTNMAVGIDIEGKVGYRLAVEGPRAKCVSPSNRWSGVIRIVSSQLPPGMNFEGLNIHGIPTKRGNYIVILELYNIYCNDSNYGSFKQELRFHIGGVGIVND